MQCPLHESPHDSKGENEHFAGDVTKSNQRLFDEYAHTAKRERKYCIRNSGRHRPGLLHDGSHNSNGENDRAVNRLCGDPSLLSIAHDLKWDRRESEGSAWW